jgi:hypothetical protein
MNRLTREYRLQSLNLLHVLLILPLLGFAVNGLRVTDKHVLCTHRFRNLD